MNKISIKKLLELLYLLPLFFLLLVLNDRSASLFRQLYIQVRYGFSVTVIIISLSVVAIFQIRNKYRDILLFTVILFFYTFTLAGVWASGRSEPTMISGLIPIVDGENYYTDALRWLNGGSFSSYSAKRPIFTAFLSTIAKVSGQSIQVMQAVIMVLMAISSYFSCKEITKVINPFGSTLFFILIFLYSRQYIGCFLSETIGLILGLSGFALLIRQRNDLRHWSFNLSIFLIALALNARAGTFFILPLLLFWIYRTQKNEKNRWKIVISSFFCMSMAFLINSLLIQYFGNGQNIPFSNFAYILYGLARGGSGWSQILTDHPELFTLEEFQLTKEIWSLTQQLILQNPQNFISGLLKQYVYLIDISQTTKNIFSFANPETHSISIFIQCSLYLLSLIGLFSLKKRDERISFLLLFSLVGILLSVPFVTVQDTLFMRAYAVTMPFIILLPCLGVDFATKKIILNTHKGESINNGFYAFIVLILLITLFLPLLLHGENRFSSMENLKCKRDESSLVFSVNKNSSIRTFPENYFFLDWAPNFHWSRFYQNIRVYSFSDFVDPLSEFDAPFELRVGINLINDEDVYIVFQGEDFIDDYGFYELCAKNIPYSDSPWMRELAKLYIVNDYQRIGH
ncbi:hypothetical protein C4588_08105 [Candidatus Parcubacteria bacterium]|nr:MAG: hypothetical protein C4588_08105 [Candidatus Parcubacteria bacterium]